jgi:type II secretion system protein J
MRISSQLSPHSARRRGFTLIEILVASVIFAILATSLFVVFKAALDSWRRTQAHLEVYQNARAALDMMTRDLSAAYLNSTNNAITFMGYNNGGTAPAWGWKTNSGGDEVYFIAALNPTLNDPNAKFELCKVGYWYDSSANQLMRYYYTQTGAAPDYNFGSANGASTKVASNIRGLNFQYYDAAGTITDTWDSTNAGAPAQLNKKPTKVEITLIVQEPNSTPIRTQTFTTGVYIPQ